MNYCTKCGSYYYRPGTCNCYVVVRPVYYPLPPYPPGPVPGNAWTPLEIKGGRGNSTIQIETAAAPDGGGPAGGAKEAPPETEA